MARLPRDSRIRASFCARRATSQALRWPVPTCSPLIKVHGLNTHTHRRGTRRSAGPLPAPASLGASCLVLEPGPQGGCGRHHGWGRGLAPQSTALGT